MFPLIRTAPYIIGGISSLLGIASLRGTSQGLGLQGSGCMERALTWLVDEARQRRFLQDLTRFEGLLRVQGLGFRDLGYPSCFLSLDGNQDGNAINCPASTLPSFLGAAINSKALSCG